MQEMDFVVLTDSPAVLSGLQSMFDFVFGEGAGDGYLPCSTVSVETALLVLAVARRAPDKDGWFPRGKWATIQAIEDRTDRELLKPFQDSQDSRSVR